MASLHTTHFTNPLPGSSQNQEQSPVSGNFEVKPPPYPYDSGWKRILHQFFFLVIQFFFPKLYQNLDTSVPPEFLENELQQLSPKSSRRTLRPDVLVKVRTKEGQNQVILVHLEVQTKADPAMSKRMYDYATRIYHHLGVLPLGILILTDSNPTFRPDTHRISLGPDLEASHPFYLVKTIDWAKNLDQLKDNPHIIAQALYVFLKTQKEMMELLKRQRQRQRQRQAKSDKNNHEIRSFLRDIRNQQKLRFKINLETHILSLGLDQKFLFELELFLDWMVSLPPLLEIEYIEKRNQILVQRGDVMAFVSSFERAAKREGIIIGEKNGVKIGEINGQISEAKSIVLRLLNRKFQLTNNDQQIIQSCDDKEILEQALEEILFAETKEQVLDLLKINN